MRPILVLACLAAAPAAAQEVADCDSWIANARNLAQPYETATRAFANGAISFLSLDTGGEPACCSAHLMVLYPDPEGPAQLCALIHRESESGYASISLDRATARYDATRGLTVRVPAATYGEPSQVPLTLDVTINQQTGVIRAGHGAP